MAAFSGKEYSFQKIRALPPDNFNQGGTESGANSIGNPRSVGKKYLPVRISTAHFDNLTDSRKPGSSCKTMGLSSRKPIRNIHKLLESPKRTVRKRLDNLYDCSKSKDNVNQTTVKAQALSLKKVAPKVLSNSVTPSKKLEPRNGLINHSKNSRHSKLLPPGTITGSYLSGRNSLASKTSIYKPANNRLTLVQKSSNSKRPSDVPEESPQPLESSYSSSNGAKELSLLHYNANKSSKDIKQVDNNISINIHDVTSPPSNSQDEKETLKYCCNCSRIIEGSESSENVAQSAAGSIKIVVDSNEIPEQNLQFDKNKTEGDPQRPTVIVMQKETAPRLATKNLNELAQVPVQDGSYSEILSLQPSVNSSAIDESLLFERTESACTRLEFHGGDKITEFIFKLISRSNEILMEQQRYFADSISQYEKDLTSMKLMLEKVNAQLDKQRTLESSMKSKGSRNLNSEQLSLLVGGNFATNITVQASFEDCETSFKEDSEFGENTIQSKRTKEKRNKKSSNVESGADGERIESATDTFIGLRLDDIKIDNIENEPPQRRRSARLAAKNDDQLLPIEQSTPTTGKKKSKITQAKSKPCTPSLTTPAPTAKWGRRSERPLREYMVLKSAIKFLNTPDSRRYQIGSDEKVKIRDSLDKTGEVLLTDKLLRELHDLYATP